MFIDETGASTNLARKGGRCRRGRRLRVGIPHGHYKTITLVAGLRLSGLVAQKAYDRPMNAATFEDWVEKCLVPTLSQGDVVVMDNLSSHKGAKVEQLIKAAGAEVGGGCLTGWTSRHAREPARDLSEGPPHEARPGRFRLSPGAPAHAGPAPRGSGAAGQYQPDLVHWLEQGRGGAPSADVLDRIARALMLTDVEREHLFLLGLGRPPEARYRKNDGVTPRLQRVLDALDPSPALIRTAIWDVVAWNRAATVMLMDYGSLPPEQRNILRFIFLDPRARAAQYDWESVARFVVGAFRVDAARAGAAAEVEPLVDELCRLSPEFKAMWRDNDVHGAHGEAVKHIRHPVLGPLAFEYSAFAVDGRTDLSMVVYNPATPADAERISSLIGPTLRREGM